MFADIDVHITTHGKTTPWCCSKCLWLHNFHWGICEWQSAEMDKSRHEFEQGCTISTSCSVCTWPTESLVILVETLMTYNDAPESHSNTSWANTTLFHCERSTGNSSLSWWLWSLWSISNIFRKFSVLHQSRRTSRKETIRGRMNKLRMCMTNSSQSSRDV